MSQTLKQVLHECAVLSRIFYVHVIQHLRGCIHHSLANQSGCMMYMTCHNVHLIFHKFCIRCSRSSNETVVSFWMMGRSDLITSFTSKCKVNKNPAYGFKIKPEAFTFLSVYDQPFWFHHCYLTDHKHLLKF